MPPQLKRAKSNRHRRRWRQEDSGQALLVVLILSLALITSVTVAVSSSVGSLDSSANFANTSQAQLTAYSGLSQATSAMAASTTIGSLPCLIGPSNMPLPQVAAGFATYSVTIMYYSSASPSPSTVVLCTGTGNTFSNTPFPTAPPMSATLNSTGSSPRTTPVTMQENVTIKDQNQLLPAFNFAMFSPGSVALTSNVQVNQVLGPPPGPIPSIYGGSISQCTDGTVIEGSVLSYSSINVNSNCTIEGDLDVRGSVAISNSVHITGNVSAFGGSVSLTSTPTIDGNVYAVNGSSGTINANTNAVTVHGSLEATGSISNYSKATIGGSVVPNDAAIATWVMPPQVPFPQLSPTPTTLSADGYNVIQVGNTLLGQVSCAVFFLPATLVSLVGSLVSNKTAIYAPSCSVQTWGLGILSPFLFSTNMVWVVKEFDTTGTTVFAPNPLEELLGTTTFNLSVIVPYGTSCKNGGNIKFTNDTEFDPRINVLLYTPCTADFTVNPTMNGQILAGTSVVGTNQFALNFDDLAAFDVPGASFPAAPVVTVESKTVSSG
jgi:cytoskeletal protein CcmA (bactofilin family)